MTKVFIKNRQGNKISVVVEENPNAKGLVFVMHGFGAFKEQKQLQTFAQAFRDADFTVVLFDTTNGLGESEGRQEDATTTSYYEDLEDIIKWAETQSWYREPFWLVGHSLGSLCIGFYTINHPEKVFAIAPISSVVSRELMLAQEPKEKIAEWEKTGWKISPSKSKPGAMKKINWNKFVEDAMKYNLLKEGDKITVPTLLIVGSEDNGTPFEHQKLLYDKLKGPKEIHVIEGAPHTFREPKHLEEVKEIFDNWIKSNI